VLDLAEAAADPHIVARGTLFPAAGGPQPAAAPRLSATPFAAAVGSDTAEKTLRRWGLRH
jgi:alpha-methylacyl-CoA racemase